MFSIPAKGDDGVAFSHPQGAALVAEFAQALGTRLTAESSDERWLHLDLDHAQVVIVLGLLGERGWQLCGLAALTGGHGYWMLRRPLP